MPPTLRSAKAYPLFPDRGEMHDDLHGLFHILAADPFQLNAGSPSARHQIA
jgi:hypothetical protein